MSQALQPVRLDLQRPFSRAQARAAGIARHELIGSRFSKVFYDRYVAASVPITLRLRAETALDLSPEHSWISHHTAAALWGGSAPVSSDIHLTTPDDCGRSVRRGIKAHTAGPEPTRAVLGNLPVSAPEQVILDLAGWGLELIDLVALGDSLVKLGRTSSLQLQRAADRSSARGAKVARRAVRLVRPGVDSVRETQLRLLLVLAGLPEPQVNVIYRNPDGSWRRRLDLSYSESKLIIEYDGRQHAFDARQWQSDLRRREELDRLGWRIIVVTADDLYRSPGEVLIRVRNALIELGVSDVRRKFRTEWMRHFMSNDERAS